MLINRVLNRQHEVHITSSTYVLWTWETTQYRLQFHASPSGDKPAPSSLLVELSPLYPCTTERHFCMVAHQKTTRCLLLGWIPDALPH